MKSLLFLSLSVSSLFFNAAFAETISLRADTWCPMNCEPDSAKPGYMIEIAKEVFEKRGDKIDYKTLNWARAIAESRKGDYTGIIGAAHEDAPDFVYPETAMGMSATCFYTKPDLKWEFKNPASLESVTLGVIRDYSYGKDIDAYIKKNESNHKRIDTVSGDTPLELNVKKLAAGRIQVIVENPAVESYFVSTQKNKIELREAGCTTPDPIYVAFSPKHPKAKEYASLLGKGVTEMRANGKLKAILAKYGMKDWAK